MAVCFSYGEPGREGTPPHTTEEPGQYRWGLKGLFSPHHESVGLPLPHTEKLPHKRKRRKSEILTDYPKGIITHICQIGLNLGVFSLLVVQSF